MISRLTDFARDSWLLLVVVTLLVVGFVVLHERATRLGASGEFMASLAQGKPTVVTF